MDAKSWIEDGKVDAEPVTTETPQPSSETVTDTAPAETAGSAQPRDESGKFVAAESATAAATAVEQKPGETQAEAVARAYIEGKLGDQPFQLPEDVLLPLKRGKDVDYRPLKEVLQDGLRLNDYSRNMNALKDRERAFEAREAEYQRQQRKVAEREKYLAEREEQVKAAMSDPKSAAAYEQHLVMMRDNPMYRATFERDWKARETEIELQQYQEERDQRLVQEASTRALGWVESLATDFPGVDPGRVAQIYGQRLSAGQASLDVEEVRRIYRSEADYIAGATKPLQDQLAELAAKIEAIGSSKAAETHNATTEHALARAKAPKVNTGGGAPVKQAVAATKFSPRELAERTQAWIQGG